MTPSSGALSSLLESFLSVFTLGLSSLSGDAMALLRIFVVLEVTIVGLWYAFGHGEAVLGLLKKVLLIGFFIFLISNYQYLIDHLVAGFIYAGLKGGGGSITAKTFGNPSAVAELGLKITRPLWGSLAQYSGLASIKHLPSTVTTILAGFLIILSFFFLGIQIFITYLEFYLVSLVGLVLLPFGVFRYTSFVSEKFFGAIIGFGVKFMVLALIASVVYPLVNAWTLPAEPQFEQILTLLLGSLAVVALAWHAPGIVGGLVSGSPSLSAGTAAGTALALGAGAFYSKYAAARGLSAGARAVKTGASATRAAATYGLSKIRSGP